MQKHKEWSVERFAEMLNGRERGREITGREIMLAKELGYIVVFDSSENATNYWEMYNKNDDEETAKAIVDYFLSTREIPVMENIDENLFMALLLRVYLGKDFTDDLKNIETIYQLASKFSEGEDIAVLFDSRCMSPTENGEEPPEAKAIKYFNTFKQSTKKAKKEAVEALIDFLFYRRDPSCTIIHGAVNREANSNNGRYLLFGEDAGAKMAYLLDEDLLNSIKKGNPDDIERKIFEIVSDAENFKWSYRTTAPHATFDIMDNGKKYCKGIVISWDAMFNPNKQLMDEFEEILFDHGKPKVTPKQLASLLSFVKDWDK